MQRRMKVIEAHSLYNVEASSTEEAMSEIALMLAEATECLASNKYSLVGATGSNFNKTTDLKVINYREATKSPIVDKIMRAIETEHDKFVKYQVWEAVNENER